jgi:hypothetical protein
MASSSWWLDNVGPTDNVQSAISEGVLPDRFCIAAPYENRHRPAVVYGLFQPYNDSSRDAARLSGAPEH